MLCLKAHDRVGTCVHHKAQPELSLLLNTVLVNELGRLTIVINLSEFNDINVVPEGGFRLSFVITCQRQDRLGFSLQSLIDAKPLTFTSGRQSSVLKTDNVDILVEGADALSATRFLLIIQGLIVDDMDPNGGS